MRALAPGVFYTFNIEWMDLSYMDYIERFITLAGDHGILVMLDLHAMEAGAWKDSGGVGTHGGELLYEAWAGLSCFGDEQRWCSACHCSDRISRIEWESLAKNYKCNIE